MKKGFTLIELLVVVLIIGILAAVALPQYQVAVNKAKVARVIPLVQALQSAQARYYLANNEYAINFADLDVAIPASCQITDASEGDSWAGQTANCEGYIIQLLSARKYVYGYFRLSDGSVMYYGMRPDQKETVATEPVRLCTASKSADSLANRLCKSFGGVVNDSNASFTYYTLP